MLWTSAGTGEERKIGEITEQHFDATFGLNARDTLFTVQKALPLFNDGGSILMTGSIASVRGFLFWSVYGASKAVLHAYARVWLSELKDRRIRERKTERLAARLTPEQDALIRRAAEVEGTDLTNFTVTAALAHARDVLADRRLFALTDAAWTEFLAALDRPVSHKPRLRRLFAERSIFDTEA